MSVATLANINVTVQRASSARGEWGTLEPVWSTHLRLRMRVQPLSSEEVILYSRDTVTITHKAYVNGTPDITEKDRLKIGSVIYKIKGVRNIDLADSFLTLELEEVR